MVEPNRHRHILDVSAPAGWDFVRLVEDVANNRPVSFAGCNVYLVNHPASHFPPEFEADLLRIGLSAFLQRQLLLEDLVPRGAPEDRIRAIFIRFLQAIGVDDELIVVDPYFFPPTPSASYASFVASILSPFSATLRRLTVVTHPKFNPSSKSDVVQALHNVNAALTVKHTYSADYHDRWWISANRSAGLFVGTSLNGLGRKYALIDRLASTDVHEIVVSLRDNALV